MKGRGYWLTVAVETQGPWPIEEKVIPFLGRELHLIPESKEFAQRVAIRCINSKATFEELRIVRRFMSAYSWVERQAIFEEFNVGCGWVALLGKSPSAFSGAWHSRYRHIKIFDYDYLPEPSDPRSWLALALYREALNTRSIHFKFLSFYKVINILHEKGIDKKGKSPSQVAWINTALKSLNDYRATKRLKELQPTVSDIGEYIYVSGRCAIAHAFATPVADPDDPADTERLTGDLDLVSALAEYAIEHELGVKSIETVIGEHLHELKGFRAFLGADLVGKLKAKQPIAIHQMPSFPSLSIRAVRANNIVQLAEMLAKPVFIKDGCVILECTTKDQLMSLRITLDFPNEHLCFNPVSDIKNLDDGSVEAVKHALAEVDLFEMIMLNGKLSVLDHQTQKPFGITESFVGVNISLRGTIKKNSERRNELENLLWLRCSPFVGACDI